MPKGVKCFIGLAPGLKVAPKITLVTDITSSFFRVNTCKAKVSCLKRSANVKPLEGLINKLACLHFKNSFLREWDSGLFTNTVIAYVEFLDRDNFEYLKSHSFCYFLANPKFPLLGLKVQR